MLISLLFVIQIFLWVFITAFYGSFFCFISILLFLKYWPSQYGWHIIHGRHLLLFWLACLIVLVAILNKLSHVEFSTLTKIMVGNHCGCGSLVQPSTVIIVGTRLAALLQSRLWGIYYFSPPSCSVTNVILCHLWV